MPDNSSLIKQLAHRCQSFHRVTGITQTQVANALNMPTGNYSSFLSGKRGIGADSVCALLKFTSMSRDQAIATFSKPVFSSQILQLQERGKATHFDNSGWVAQEGGSGDPLGTTDITDTNDAVTKLVGVFGSLPYLTRQAVVDQLTRSHAALPPTNQKFQRKGRGK